MAPRKRTATAIMPPIIKIEPATRMAVFPISFFMRIGYMQFTENGESTFKWAGSGNRNDSCARRKLPSTLPLSSYDYFRDAFSKLAGFRLRMSVLILYAQPRELPQFPIEY